MYSLSLFWDNRQLSRQNQTLTQQSHALGQVLERLSVDQRLLETGSEKRKKEGAELKEEVETLKKQNETLAFQIQKLTSQITQVKEEKSYLEEMLINKSKEIELLKKRERSSSIPAAEVETGRISSQIGDRDEELKKLNEENRLLQEKLDRLFRTTNEKISEINVAKIALAETVSTAQKKIEDEWSTVNLGTVTTRALPAGRQAMPARQNEIEEAPAPHEPKTQGHVLAINNEHGFVVIDMGKADNLPEDALLEVRKEGGPVATLSVLEIRDVMAACNIKEVKNGQRIDINDVVSFKTPSTV